MYVFFDTPYILVRRYEIQDAILRRSESKILDVVGGVEDLFMMRKIYILLIVV